MSKSFFALALASGLALPLSPAAHAGESFDGNWSVNLVTESGVCAARYNYALTVQGGQVRPVSQAGTRGATVSGRVGGDGRVALTVATSAASGAASGQLRARGGSGTWRVSALCSGRWTAQRHDTRTAQAD